MEEQSGRGGKEISTEGGVVGRWIEVEVGSGAWVGHGVGGDELNME